MCHKIKPVKKSSFEKFVVSQLINKFFAFVEPEVLFCFDPHKRVLSCHLKQLNPSHPFNRYYYKIQYFPLLFSDKFCMHFLCPSCALHV